MNAHSAFGQNPPMSGVRRWCGDMFNFVKHCAIYMHRYSPSFLKPDRSEQCCAFARKVNVVLFCKIFLIKDTEKMFDPIKVAMVASYCGKPLPRYTKCGSKSQFLDFQHRYCSKI
ncbi:hypothetical protein Salat_2864700 [Sesamum alatum]|uniref:Bifunctional inhibitor/plant lipid transfer protein/seed storage helical domain-containing protein n=1 Tax=Sesamum alatum TaxID=300844 RepID=A0AAE1XMA6_9LAMI|nr:hypothetical protein Salat_2864700 [Sesamum alatum]